MCSSSRSDIKIREIYEIVNRISSFPHLKMYGDKVLLTYLCLSIGNE